MKHHFGELLDRDGEYWSVVPNRERFAFPIGNTPAGSEEIRIVTVEKDDDSWRNIFTFPNLEELTLHGPTSDQLFAISELSRLKRLRITHARPKDLGFLAPLSQVEELVLEYVSGFEDLSPLSSLTRLKSLHLENLRRVKDFGGLHGITRLRYLAIDGTLDWKQPIADFEFLRGLPNLEVLGFGFIISQAPFPAMLPVLSLPRLKRLRLPRNMLAAREYALLESGLSGVTGAAWGPFWRLESSGRDAWFEFTGKGAGRVKCGSVDADRKCAEYSAKYSQWKAEVQDLAAQSRSG